MSSRLQGLTGLLAVEATVETDTVEPDLMGLVTPQAAEEVAVSGNAPVLIPLSKIRKSPFQPRSFFNYEKIQKMADKFRQYREAGIRPKTVILVRPVPGEDAYELVFGEQRKIAHEKANYTDVLAFVDDTITDEEARELALTENLLREDLNPVEKTEGILNLAAIKLGTSPEGVRQLLDKAANQRKQHTDNVTRTEQWKTLEAFFHELPDKITPESFRTNYLPLLKLPSDVLEVLHQGKIEYTKAKAIAGIKQDRQRQQLLQRAIQQNLSIREIRDEVREIKVAGDNSPTLTTTPTTSISDRITQLGKQAKRSKALQQPERRHEIDRLLDKLEYLLSE